MSQPPPSTDAPGLPDLPPVEAPTAGFIVQLFVIPAVIVAVVVAVWLVFGKLAGGERDAMDYVRTIETETSNRRFRAAYELASLIRNDNKLATDPELLGRLADLLARELDKGGDPEIEQYLATTLGSFRTLATKGAADPLATLARAVDVKQETKVRLAAVYALASQAAREEGKLDAPEAVKALAAAAEDPEAEVRQMASFALGFFGGEPAEAALRGRVGDPDKFTRFNAAIALGRRGDPAALPVFRDMLTPASLAKLIRMNTGDETRSKIESIELDALQALLTSSTAGRPALAESLRGEVTALSKSGLVGVRSKAGELLQILPKSP